jgi:hypothetical protein
MTKKHTEMTISDYLDTIKTNLIPSIQKSDQKWNDIQEELMNHIQDAMESHPQKSKFSQKEILQLVIQEMGKPKTIAQAYNSSHPNQENDLNEIYFWKIFHIILRSLIGLQFLFIPWFFFTGMMNYLIGWQLSPGVLLWITWYIAVGIWIGAIFWVPKKKVIQIGMRIIANILSLCLVSAAAIPYLRLILSNNLLGGINLILFLTLTPIFLITLINFVDINQNFFGIDQNHISRLLKNKKSRILHGKKIFLIAALLSSLTITITFVMGIIPEEYADFNLVLFLYFLFCGIGGLICCGYLIVNYMGINKIQIN